MFEIQRENKDRRGRFSPFFGRGVLLSLGLIAADQLSKWWIFEHVLRINGSGRSFGAWLLTPYSWQTYHQSPDFAELVLTPFANLVMVFNRGVSFGMLAGETAWGLIGLSAAITLGLLSWLAWQRSALVAAALGLVIGGAVSNILDRVRFGAVADFLDVHVAGYHWPAFNLADAAIVCGAVLLALDALGRDFKKTEGETG